MTYTDQQLEHLLDEMRTFETDLDKAGWDQEPTLGFITETDGNLAIVDPDQIEGHPVEFLRAVIQMGIVLKDAAVGVILSSESWGLSEDESNKTGVMPSQSPNRKEMRAVTVMLRDGTQVQLMHTRGGDVHTHIIRPEDEIHARAMRTNVPSHLYMFLTGDDRYLKS